jgi:branched-subunit amino acid transport protein
MTTLLAIIVTGCGTYLSRALFILMLAKRRIPPNLILAMEFVAPAVFGALIATMLVSADGEVTAGLPELAGLVVAGLTAWRTRNHIYTLSAGMAVFWLVGWLQGIAG